MVLVVLGFLGGLYEGLPSLLPTLWRFWGFLGSFEGQGPRQIGDIPQVKEQAGFIEKCHLDHKEPGRWLFGGNSGHIR